MGGFYRKDRASKPCLEEGRGAIFADPNSDNEDIGRGGADNHDPGEYESSASSRSGPSRIEAVIAGCGDLGTALGLILAARGAQVTGIRRSTISLPAPLRTLSLDLADLDMSKGRQVPSLMTADIVVYAVAAGRRDEDAYRRAYIEGVDALSRVLEMRDTPPKRFFFVSSTSVYGECAGRPVDEDTPPQPQGFPGESLLAGERRVLESPLPATVVRLGGIYGPGRTWLIDRVRQGGRCLFDPPKFTNRIHRDDAAQAIAHLADLAQSRPIADTYIAVDHEPAAECEVMEWLAKRIGAPPVERARGSKSLDSTPGAGGGKRCRNGRLLSEGYVFRYPSYREGYRAVLEGKGVRYRPAKGGRGAIVEPVESGPSSS
ncbi:SDR family oxidoreductase [Thioalkalivibrio sp. HK1]|uniref:SDR family oxidoreductase n=1 Tax=Thioalkalivibrio sp. HK1 TaxID=1469245 RepID=UPI00046EEA2D|nr:SDR family oxidoreductase [Thioalkalivibrio sp. HK1]